MNTGNLSISVPAALEPFQGEYRFHRALRRIWFLNALNRTERTAGIHILIRLEPRARIEALRMAWEACMRRHAAFRMGFGTEDSGTLDAWKSVPPAIAFTIVGCRDREAREAAVLRELRSGFAPENGLLAKACVLECESDDNLLFASFSNLCMDGVSLANFFPDFAGLYALITEGRPIPGAGMLADDCLLKLGALEVSARREPREPSIADEVAAWSLAMAELDANPNASIGRGEKAPGMDHDTREWDGPDLERLESIHQATGLETEPLLLALFALAGGRTMGTWTLPIGVPFSKRPLPGMEKAIGFFVDIGHVLARPEPGMGFAAFAAAVSRACLAFRARSETDLQDYRNTGRGAGAAPTFRLLFDYMDSDLGIPGGSPFRPVTDPGFADSTLASLGIRRSSSGDCIAIRFNSDLEDILLNLSARRSGPKLHLSLLFNKAVFDRAKAAALHAAMERILRMAALDPDCPIGSMPLLPPGEAGILAGFSQGPIVPLPAQETVHALFAARVDSFRNRVAVIEGGAQRDYGELDRESRRIAQGLAVRGIGCGDLVGIIMEPSFEFICAVLGVLRAGGAYVPIDCAQPTEKRDRLLRHCAASAVLFAGNAGQAAGIPGLDAGRIPPDPSAAIDRPQSGESLCYVVFTSGTSGSPKGVSVSHRAAINAVEASIERYGGCRKNNNLFNSSIGFDSTFGKVFQCILSGGTIVVPDRDDGSSIWDLARRHGISRFGASPSELAVLDRDPQVLPDLEVIGSAGEQLRKFQIKNLSSLYRIINIYGPSEATVSCAYFDGDISAVTNDSPVPIGRPIRNYTIRIVDPFGWDVPIGTVGEIVVGGLGLASGYFGNPKLTAERFRTHPSGSGRVEYWTGDFGEWREDGNLLFAGRKDAEIKLRGQRIDLREIEEGLFQATGCAAVAACVKGEGADAVLLGFHCRKGLEESEARTALARYLPTAWIPSRVCFVETLPVTLHGKVDVRALAGMVPERAPAVIPAEDMLAQAIARVWEDHLGHGKIGLDTDFFMAGGNSLSAAQMIMTVDSLFGISLGLRAFLACPTVACIKSRLQVEAQAALLTTVSHLVIKYFDARVEARCLSEQIP